MWWGMRGGNACKRIINRRLFNFPFLLITNTPCLLCSIKIITLWPLLRKNIWFVKIILILIIIYNFISYRNFVLSAKNDINLNICLFFYCSTIYISVIIFIFYYLIIWIFPITTLFYNFHIHIRTSSFSGRGVNIQFINETWSRKQHASNSFCEDAPRIWLRWIVINLESRPRKNCLDRNESYTIWCLCRFSTQWSSNEQEQRAKRKICSSGWLLSGNHHHHHQRNPPHLQQQLKCHDMLYKLLCCEECLHQNWIIIISPSPPSTTKSPPSNNTIIIMKNGHEHNIQNVSNVFDLRAYDPKEGFLSHHSSQGSAVPPPLPTDTREIKLARTVFYTAHVVAGGTPEDGRYAGTEGRAGGGGMPLLICQTAIRWSFGPRTNCCTLIWIV